MSRANPNGIYILSSRTVNCITPLTSVDYLHMVRIVTPGKGEGRSPHTPLMGGRVVDLHRMKFNRLLWGKDGENMDDSGIGKKW